MQSSGSTSLVPVSLDSLGLSTPPPPPPHPPTTPERRFASLRRCASAKHTRISSPSFSSDFELAAESRLADAGEIPRKAWTTGVQHEALGTAHRSGCKCPVVASRNLNLRRTGMNLMAIHLP